MFPENLDVGEIIPNQHQNNFFIFDFSQNNEELQNIDISDAREFSEYINKTLRENNCEIGIGRYNEDRIIYDHSNIFDGTARRTIHLAIDIFMPSETEIKSPLDGRIHSFNNNQGYGDYGPTIIIEHEIDGIIFYTLYGHLSLNSIENLEEGQEINRGDIIGMMGNYPINGNWPPHLHFQIIMNIENNQGDFPGVCSTEERERFLELCPNPNLILQITDLENKIITSS